MKNTNGWFGKESVQQEYLQTVREASYKRKILAEGEKVVQERFLFKVNPKRSVGWSGKEVCPQKEY